MSNLLKAIGKNNIEFNTKIAEFLTKESFTFNPVKNLYHFNTDIKGDRFLKITVEENRIECELRAKYCSYVDIYEAKTFDNFENFQKAYNEFIDKIKIYS